MFCQFCCPKSPNPQIKEAGKGNNFVLTILVNDQPWKETSGNWTWQAWVKSMLSALGILTWDHFFPDHGQKEDWPTPDRQ